MANADIARGLIPVRHMNGAPWNGAARVYFVPASDAVGIFRGDPVKTVTDASDANGIQTVTRASAGDTLIGVMVGVVSAGEPAIAVTRDSTIYRAASVATYVLVVDAPDMLFEVQEDGIGGVVTVGAVGRNADLVSSSAGSTATGYSGYELDSSTLATTTAQVRIMEAVARADNDPTIAEAKWLVKILEHQLLTATGV